MSSLQSAPSPVPLPSRDEQLTVTEALASIKIGRSTLYKLIAAEQIPAVRIGRLIRLSAATVRHLAEHGLTDQAVA